MEFEVCTEAAYFMYVAEPRSGSRRGSEAAEIRREVTPRNPPKDPANP